MPMPLNQLLGQARDARLIRELTLDSRAVRPGDLFLAVPGARQDGRRYIQDAIARGAAAVAYEAQDAAAPQAASVPLVPVNELAAQLSFIAGRFYGEPSRALRLVGVTGTNGKTSVTYLLAQALDALGERCGILGTLGSGFYAHLQQGRLTTPDAVSVQAALAGLKKNGAQAVAMEVSSHGLRQGRVAALEFKGAVLTNLTRDHLDYHGSMADYGEAKAVLFAWPSLRFRVLNLDDDFGRALVTRPGQGRLIGYALDDESAAVHCSQARFSEQGVRAYLHTGQGEGLLHSPLLGRFNLSNLLAVVAALLGLDYPLAEILQVLPKLQGPPGRVQRIGGQGRPVLVVDYAHTPDSLEKVLQALRPHVRGRLCCLFGCGGDRDPGKRPLMAAVAERLADRVWVTDDNPRSEAPQAILDDIRAGFAHPQQVQFQVGRDEAIARAVADLQVDDILLLAGKGHEDYQEIAGQRLPFSDMQQAREALDAWEAAHA